MNALVEFSLKNRFLILVFTLVVICVGIWSVQILTTAAGLGPVEVEKLITFPVETSMSGLPGIKEIRSISRFGLSAVTVFFDEGLDIYFCRSLVLERLSQAKEMIPPGF